MTSTWQPLGLIPNTLNYPLQVIDNLGGVHRATVRQAYDGTYYLCLPRGVGWSHLMGWRPA